MPYLIIAAVAAIAAAIIAVYKRIDAANNSRQARKIMNTVPPPKPAPTQKPTPPQSKPTPPKPVRQDLASPDRYVVLDLETTGLSPRADSITEFAAVVVENGKITREFSRLVKPRKPIPDDVAELTGITNDMVSAAPSINIILPQFLDFIGDNILIGYNIGFDSKFISHACQRFRLRYTNKIIDVLPMARKALPDLPNHKLKTVCQNLHITNAHAHRALSDVYATQQVYEALRKCTKPVIQNHPQIAEKQPRTSSNAKTAAIQGLQNLLLEIVADGRLDPAEVAELQDWLTDNADLCGSYPFDVIARNISAALADGVLEQSELSEMLEIFTNICIPKYTHDGTAIDIAGKIVVFTGECRAGDREEVTAIVERAGATVRKSVSGKTDYLIIGEFGSPDWAFGNYGGDVLKACELQEKGKEVKIIGEKEFFENLTSAKGDNYGNSKKTAERQLSSAGV